MNETTRALSGYYREIRSWLPCSRQRKDQIIARFQDRVQEYCNDHPAADFGQIRAHFGTPDEIAGSYVEELGTMELLRSMRIRRKILAIVAATAAVILISWAAVVCWSIKEIHANIHGTVITETGQIISSTEVPD